MFPLPRCYGCGSRDACARTATARPEYPSCLTPLRGVDAERTTALLRWLARASGVDADAVLSLEGALIDRFRRDRLQFSDVLEASFSCDAAGAHLYRFSYAFPGLRADPEGVAAALLDLCRPFGPHAEDAARTVLRATRLGAVAQLLFGFAHDGAAGSRVKLYLQFHARAQAAAIELAARILGRRLDDLPAPRRLHLLCLDLGARGLAGAKLYLAHERIALADLPARVGPAPLAAALGELGVVELRDVLAIHRLAGPGDGGLARAAEIDFSLPDNALRWDDVRALPPVRSLLARSPEVAELWASFRLAARRVSGSVGAGDKLNVYYVLTEVAA